MVHFFDEFSAKEQKVQSLTGHKVAYVAVGSERQGGNAGKSQRSGFWVVRQRPFVVEGGVYADHAVGIHVSGGTATHYSCAVRQSDEDDAPATLSLRYAVAQPRRVLIYGLRL